VFAVLLFAVVLSSEQQGRQQEISHDNDNDKDDEDHKDEKNQSQLDCHQQQPCSFLS